MLDVQKLGVLISLKNGNMQKKYNRRYSPVFCHFYRYDFHYFSSRINHHFTPIFCRCRGKLRLLFDKSFHLRKLLVTLYVILYNKKQKAPKAKTWNESK